MQKKTKGRVPSPPQHLERNEVSHNGPVIQNLDENTETLIDDDWDEVKWEHFCRYNDELDKIRQHEEGWRDIFPELVDMLNKHGIQHEF